MASLQKPYRSPPFRFVVEGQAFYIHADLVSGKSKPLDRLINGGMKEQEQGWAELEGVDAATFERFIEWAYKGSYTAALPVIDFETKAETQSDDTKTQSKGLFGNVTSSSVLGASSVQAASTLFSSGDRTSPFAAPSAPTTSTLFTPSSTQATTTTLPFAASSAVAAANFPPSFSATPNAFSRTSNFSQSQVNITDLMVRADNLTGRKSPKNEGSKNKTPTKRELMKNDFLSRVPPFFSFKLSAESGFAFNAGIQNHTEVFLSHAKLYVFADQKDITGLKCLAYDHLYATLGKFTLCERRTGDIIALIRYVYDNTCVGSSPATQDKLRALMTGYVGFEMDVLMKNKEFNKLLIEDGGDLLDDFMKVVMQRI